MLGRETSKIRDGARENKIWEIAFKNGGKTKKNNGCWEETGAEGRDENQQITIVNRGEYRRRKVRKMEVTSEMPGHCAWFKTHNKHNRQFRC
jgi:hypothetical protein